MFKPVIRKLYGSFIERLERKKHARLRIWHSFCEQTPLQGFLIFRDSHFRFEKAVWLLLIAAAIAVTFRDSVKTIRGYLEEETFSKVSMELNESIVLPNPTICINFAFTNFSYKEGLYSFSETENREAQLFLHHNKDNILYYFGPLAKKLDSVQVTWQIYETYSEYFRNESATLIPTLYLTSYLVRSILASDDEIEYPINNSFDNRHKTKQPYHYLNDFFNRNGINLAEAQKTTGMYLCLLSGLKTYRFLPYYGLWADWCKSRYVTDVRVGSVCVRGGQAPYLFNFTKGELDNQVFVSWVPRTNAVVTKQVYVHFNRPRFIEFTEGENEVSSLNSVLAIDVISTTKYPTKKFICGREMDFGDCRSKCFQDVVRAKCGCTMLNSYYYYCSNSVCNDVVCLSSVTANKTISDFFVQQTNCKAKLYANKDLTAECAKRCPEACLQLHLHFTEIPQYEPLRANHLSLTISKQTYLNIEQALAMDTQTFMANQGGNLGLYIGGTFLALFHLITSLFRLVVSLIRAKEESEATPVVPMEIHNCSTNKEMCELKEAVAKMKEEIQHLKEENHAFRETARGATKSLHTTTLRGKRPVAKERRKHLVVESLLSN